MADVSSIGEYAFERCLAKYIVISNNIKYINRAAFYYCNNLTSITIPDSVTFIDDFAFDGCSSLTSVTIPEGVNQIGIYAFAGCKALTSISYPVLSDVEAYSFNGCSSLTNVVLYNLSNPNTDPGLPVSDNLKIYVPTISVNIYKSLSAYEEYIDYIYGFHDNKFIYYKSTSDIDAGFEEYKRHMR